jgi:hypothetical protein
VAAAVLVARLLERTAAPKVALATD